VSPKLEGVGILLEVAIGTEFADQWNP